MKLHYNHRPFDGTVPDVPDESWALNDHEEPDETLAARKIHSGLFDRVDEGEPGVQPVAVAAARRAGEEEERGPSAPDAPGAERDTGRARGGPGR